MIYRFPLRNVKDMLLNQISNNYFKSIDDEMLISKHMPIILEKFENNIKNNENKYYSRINEKGEREAYFDPLHTCQWLLFLYIAANTIYYNETEKKEAARVVCDKIYGQSKIISGCDLYYEVQMPDTFSFDHPTGSFIGRATIGDNFNFTQGCTVDHYNAVYPVIGKNVTMKNGSTVLGNSHIGDNCFISAGAMIVDEDIPAGSIVSGKSPNLVITAR
ncbi:MAG: hypothetical protein MJ104_01270 [Lachnospiraceae bacterium]|nr:hypothetical protein [Lachnospiraceae bacterium]